MTLTYLWSMFTYVFRMFALDRRPEYIKKLEDLEFCYQESDNLDVSNYTSVEMIRY